MINPDTEPYVELEASLAQSIAAVMSDEADAAETGDRAHSEDMADLFLEELNRLWAEPAPLTLS